MQKLKQLYRSSYAGENIITQLTYENGDWNPETEMVPNQVFNTYTTTQALAIGNGESRLGFNLTHIANHKGGLFGSNRLQTYGCNALYRDFAPDFLVAVGDKIVKEIAESTYPNENIVYANGQHIIDYPGKFYLIPQNVAFDAGALAVYLACFDGHKKIFLLGYDGYDVPSPINNVYKGTNGYADPAEIQNEAFWNMSLHTVIETYSDVEFVSVMPTQNWYLASVFDSKPNFRQIDFRDFVLEADIG
jgi:hypothetical protein